MPRFGERLRRTATEEQPSRPEQPPAEPSAEQRLAELLAEQSEIERELAEHRTRRERWVTSGVGDLVALGQIAEADDQRRQRAEQLVALITDAQAAVREAHAAQRAAQWDAMAHDLEAAMQDTASAVRAYETASSRYRDLHWQATQSGFETELREQFVTPPAAVFNPWVFAQFAAAVERRGQPQAVVEATIIPAPALGLGVLRDPWKPLHGGKVPPDQIEAISALAPRRLVRFLHRVDIFRVEPGYAVVEAGTEMWLNARAAFACCYIGAAVEVEQPAEMPAA
jgi:hypothetical protein